MLRPMISALPETLDHLKTFIPQALVPSASLTAIRSLGSQLPDAMSFFYLECLLGADSDRVDLLASVSASVGRVRFSDYLPQIRATHASEWNAINRFFEVWLTESSMLHSHVPFVWLEFDAAGEHLPNRQPSFLFCVDEGCLGIRDGYPRKVPVARSTARRTCVEGLDALFDGQMPAAPLVTLNRCLDAIPRPGGLAHISVMFSRPTVEIKINVCLPVNTVVEYLQRIECPISFSEFSELLRFTYAHEDMAQLDIAVTEQVRPRVGLEFFHTRRYGTRDDLLESLRVLGICAQEKLDALRDWPGNSLATFRGQAWPLWLCRRLDAKIVYEPKGRISAKAYLGFGAEFSIV